MHWLVINMTLDELKVLLGIPLDDESQDVKLALFLESGLLAAQKYCDKLDFMQLIDPISGKLELPGPVKLGISEWVKSQQEIAERGTGVTSESVPGMSQSFGSASDQFAVFATAHAHWAPFHSQIKFYKAGR